MADVVELRRVPCVRTFPHGCGPHAMIIDQKPDAVLLPPPLCPSKPGSPGPDDKSVPPQRMPGSSSLDEKLRLSQLLNNGSEHPKVSCASGTDLSSLADGILERPCTPKMYPPPVRRAVSSVRDFPIGCGPSAPRVVREQVPKRAEEETTNAEAPTENKIDDRVKERIEDAEVSSDNTVDNGMKERIEIKNTEDTGKVPSDDEISKGMKEQIEAKSIEEETINAEVSTGNGIAGEMIERIEVRDIRGKAAKKEVREAMVSKPLSSPNSDSLEVEINHLVVKENVLKESNDTIAMVGKTFEEAIEPLRNYPEGTSKTLRENEVLASASTDRWLNEKAIESPINNLEARKNKTPASRNLVYKRLSSEKLTGKLVKSVKIQKILKRKFADAAADEDSIQIEQKLDAENLEAYGDRLIIQALVASPNCPWRQGRKLDTPGSHSVLTSKSKMKRVGTASAMQLAFPKSGREGEPLANQHALQKLKRERAASDVQLALAKKRREDSTSGSQATSEEMEHEDFTSDHEQNEQTIIVHQESSEPCDAVLPLSVYRGSQSLSVTIPPSGPSGWDYSGSNRQDIADRLKVRRVLRLFQVLCRKLLQSEEAKLKISGNTKRVDLTAAQTLKKDGEWVNVNTQTIGSVPGVEVGDEFQYRVELSIVGLHRPFQAGIDWITKNGLKIATSIVASGGYNDDMDSSDVLIYSGSGGNPSGPNKPPEDQKLERGNLSLKNSIDTKTPVRVVHGIKEMKVGNSYDGKPRLVSTFTYAGLYLVEKYWQEQGPHGFNVFMFQLRRISGQPELALQEVKRTKKSKIREGLCIKDISEGKEKIPICVINTINDERPPPFKYITNIKYPSWYTKALPKGCDCTRGCSESNNCSCAVKNSGEIPFNFNGAIVQAKPLVFECGPSCKCPPSCHNRVSQRGIQIPLEIFRTKNMGWGVRSLYSIPSGSFICEYVGELLDDKEAEKSSNDEYLFDIGHNYEDGSLWEGLSSHMPDHGTSSRCNTVDDVGFTIDAAEYGNVGRFINHSCSPNLYAQNVLYDHDDRRIPHIMLFAAENIPPLKELTYHYNYSVGQVRDAEGNVKRKDCFCGSIECIGRLY